MKTFPLIGALVVCAAVHANPVAMPSLCLTGENVLVGVAPDGIAVMGTYRFHVVPGYAPGKDLRTHPVPGWVRLPIPVPESDKIDKGLLSVMNPELVFRGVTFKPIDRFAKFTTLPTVAGVKFVAVEFDLGPIHEPEIEVMIRYTQAVIHWDGKRWAYYLPLIEGFGAYEKSLGLRSSSYAVSFEAYQGTSIALRSECVKVLHSSPKLISVEAHDRELIEVEIRPNKSVQRNAGIGPAISGEASPIEPPSPSLRRPGRASEA